MIQLLLAVVSTVPGFARVPPLGRTGDATDTAECESLDLAAGAETADDEGYCDITLPLILQSQARRRDEV